MNVRYFQKFCLAKDVVLNNFWELRNYNLFNAFLIFQFKSYALLGELFAVISFEIFVINASISAIERGNDFVIYSKDGATRMKDGAFLSKSVSIANAGLSSDKKTVKIRIFITYVFL